MSSSELMMQLENFKSQVNQVKTNYENVLEMISDINEVFESSDDTILQSIATETNIQIIDLCNSLVSKIETLLESIVNETNNGIASLKKQESEFVDSESAE